MGQERWLDLPLLACGQGQHPLGGIAAFSQSPLALLVNPRTPPSESCRTDTPKNTPHLLNGQQPAELEQVLRVQAEPSEPTHPLKRRLGKCPQELGTRWQKAQAESSRSFRCSRVKTGEEGAGYFQNL